MQHGSDLESPKPDVSAAGRVIGEPFNPWHKLCGFYPPDIVGRQRDFTDGQKRLYERAVRWAGQNGTFWYGFDTIAEALGKSVRQVKDDMAVLEAKGLIRHTRRRRQSNKYFFLWHAIFDVQPTAHQEAALEVQHTPLEVQDGVVLKVQPTAQESSPLESSPLNYLKADKKLIPGGASQERRSPASPSELLEAKAKINTSKADQPAETAGEEKTFSVEKEKTKADSNFPPWTGRDVSQIQKLLSAFMDGEEPPVKLIEWICTTFEEFCPAGDVFAALEAAWSHSAAPGKKNTPRTWNWFYPTLRNALIPGESARLPERPAAPHPDHRAKPAELRSGLEAIELANAPRSIVESVPCAECGGCALARYTDGTVEGCLCRDKRDGSLRHIADAVRQPCASELLPASTRKVSRR